MIFSAARILELHEATRHSDLLLESRMNDVANLPSAAKRVSASALLRLTTTYPGAARGMLNAAATAKGFRFLGSGVEFSAYLDRSSSKVVKIKRDSAGCSPSEQQQMVEKIRYDYRNMQRYFPAATIEQEVAIAGHILGGGYQAVQLTQPYVDIHTESTPFQTDTPSVDAAKIDRIIRDNPGADVALRELCHTSEIFYERTGALPDTNGAHNIVVNTDGSVTLIDLTPIDPRYTATLQLVGQQLQSLQHALDEVAA